MMRNFSFLIVLLFLFSCEKEKFEPETTLSALDYPVGSGTSGDQRLSIIGYGIDASGFCDTISVKAKIAEFSESNIKEQNTFESASCMISDTRLFDLQKKLTLYPYKSRQENTALYSHICSLLKLTCL